MSAIVHILSLIISLYSGIVLFYGVVSWLKAFGNVDVENKNFQAFVDFCAKVSEPALVKIRSFVPLFGKFDASFLVLIFILFVLRILIVMVLI